MNIYNFDTLKSYWLKHSQSKKTLELWYVDVKSKNCKKPGEVKKDFATARIIRNNRIVFNIKGNDYRLMVEFNYQKGWAFVKFIGTHVEYDKIDAERIDVYIRKNRK